MTEPVPTYALSDWERTNYYNGISSDPPELLYRSDLFENPFPIPKGRFPHLRTKTVHGVFNTPLNAVWGTVAPQIRQLLKARNIRYSVIHTARFVTHGEDGKDTLGPIVIWIATHPGTTTAENAHDASPGILALLEANGVEGAVVEWYEGAVERLSGPHLLRIADASNLTHHVHHFPTAAPGMPIATADREAQGSVTLFFHENKDKHGAPSAVLATVTFFARTPPSNMSSRTLAHLPGTSYLPDPIDTSAAPTRSRPASVATEPTPTSWLWGSLSRRRSRRASTRRRRLWRPSGRSWLK